MHEIEPPDSHFLSAAIGWLELGLPSEAEVELSRLNPDLRRHPDVLEVRWMLLARNRRWSDALEVARALLSAAPNRSSGWLHQAYALRRASPNGLEEAWQALLPAHEKFPREPIIPYNLSCYACQMRQFDEARNWLMRALKLGDKARIKQMALIDPDLQPIWEDIRAL